MARILALFAVAPAADPKSLLGAIDVPGKMSGNLKFFNFENSIFKLNFILSNFKLSFKTFFQGHSKFEQK
jgi:hypothetical protein